MKAIVKGLYSQRFFPKKKNELYFWKRETKGALVEVDCLYDYQNKVVPIEVKSGHGSALRSLHHFLLEHQTFSNGVRFWSQNYSTMDNILSKPLYAVATLAHSDQLAAFQMHRMKPYLNPHL